MADLDEVDLWLDLRRFSEPLSEPVAFKKFWDRFEPALAGQKLVTGNTHTIEAGNERVGLTVIRAPQGGVMVSRNTRFAIRGLLEPPALRYVCRICRTLGRSSYGPFICPGCEDAHGNSRICDQHVVILDGSMRSTCQEHAPHCDCGAAATFWCQGPKCRRQQSWCDRHRRQHANDPDHSYCEACYELVYPECERAGCGRVGTLSCEHVDPTSYETCGRRACPSHMSRWQVYGPEREGLTLCSAHRQISRLPDDAIVAQMILGTAARRQRVRRPVFLPTLQSVRHILRKARGRLYDIQAVAALFDNFSAPIRAPAQFQRTVKDLLSEYAVKAAKNISRDQEERAKGRQYFERLKSALVAAGKWDLAEAVGFSDYRPKLNRLYVTLPDMYKARFIGRGGSTIKEISAIVGAEVKLERADTGLAR